MSIKTMALGVVVAAAAFAVPAEAQIWKRGDVVVRSDERVISRNDSRTYEGARCVQVQIDRYGDRRNTTVCDWDRDGVYGDSDDRRIYEQRRRDGRRDPGYGYWEYRNAGQRRAAEVHARNEARKREQEYERRQRELTRERQKREQDALKERQKREREAQKNRQKGNGRWG